MIQAIKNSSTLLKLAGIAATVFALIASSGAFAATQQVSYSNVPFTQQEIDDNWFVDRAVPSGGYGSVSYAGLDDVMEMNIDGDNRSTDGSFFHTEGLQREVGAEDATALKGDLYVESSWLTHDVRAGLWGVGHDVNGDISAFPITEFTTAGEDAFIGWRVWDGVLGDWTNLPDVAFNEDAWNDLEIVYNADTNMFDHYINGELVANTTGGDSVDFGAVILNNFNYGPDGTDYSVHWSDFGIGEIVVSPDTKDECKRGGWAEFEFRNQGQCIRYVNTGQDSRLE